MCDLCAPRISRRRLIGGLVAGGAAVSAATLLGPPTALAAVPVAPGLDIEPRSNWAGEGRPPTGPLSGETVQFLLVHHTASANGADPVETMRTAYGFHTSPEKGWPDVAYNFFIDQNGITWEGRAGSIAGPVEASATGGSQGFAQLVCLLGDFTDVLPTPAALIALNRTLAWLADREGIAIGPTASTSFVSRGSNLWPAGTTVETNTIAGHRDMSRTACPGDTFYPYLVDNVAEEVAALRSVDAAPTTDLPTTAPPTTVSTTAPDTTAPPATVPPTVAPPTTGLSPATVPATTSTASTSDPAAPDQGAFDLRSPVVIAGLAAVTIAAGATWYVARRTPEPPPAPDAPDDGVDG